MKVDTAAALVAESWNKVTPAILVFDIETTPIEAYCWRTFKENIGASQVRRPSEILCYAAKWLGRDMVAFGRRGKTDREVCKEIRKLFSAAELIIAHNGQAFDIPTMKARWAKWQMTPPSPYKVVDTCKLARRAFNFPHNSLEGLARYLDLGGKVEHEGFSLWVKCLAEDPKAWAAMEKYNIHDVVLLEEVYKRLRAWDTRHPNVGLLYPDGAQRCVVCGSRALKRLRTTAKTNVSEFEAYRCKDCGKINRTGERLGGGKETMRNAI